MEALYVQSTKEKSKRKEMLKMEENRGLIDRLCEEALSQRFEKIKIATIEEIANEVRNALLGGMDKKEFAKWFDVMIAEHKSQLMHFPHSRW